MAYAGPPGSGRGVAAPPDAAPALRRVRAPPSRAHSPAFEEPGYHRHDQIIFQLRLCPLVRHPPPKPRQASSHRRSACSKPSRSRAAASRQADARIRTSSREPSSSGRSRCSPTQSVLTAHCLEGVNGDWRWQVQGESVPFADGEPPGEPSGPELAALRPRTAHPYGVCPHACLACKVAGVPRAMPVGY